MPLYPSWPDIAVRLVLTMAAGAIIGFNRGVRGQAAGLRTTMLVGLAASVAMIQANVLLSVSGKTGSSFGIMDLMRLPLGILTGVGFIGAGAIFRRGDLVTGVTTAATLWVVTVIGLCFGGGQIELGIAATALVVLTLWALRWIDMRIPREQSAMLVVKVDPRRFDHFDLPVTVAPLGYRARFHKQNLEDGSGEANAWFEIYWTRAEIASPPAELLQLLNKHYSVISFELTSETRH